MNLIDEDIRSRRDYSVYYNYYIYLDEVKTRALTTSYIIVSVKSLNQLTDDEINQYYTNHTEDRREKDLYTSIKLGITRMTTILANITTVRDYHVHEAITNNCIPILKILLPRWRNLELCELNVAVRYSNNDMIEFIINQGVAPTFSTAIYAATSGRLELVKHCEIDESRLTELLTSAAQSGNEELYKYVLKLGASSDYTTHRAIVYSDNPELFKYIISFNSSKLIDVAVMNGKINTIKYLSRIAHPNIEKCRHLVEYQFDDFLTRYISPQFIDRALSHGSPQWIDYILRTYNLTLSKEQILRVGKNSKVEVFRYIYERYNIKSLLPELLENSNQELISILIKNFNIKPTYRVIRKITDIELIKYIYNRYKMSRIPILVKDNQEIIDYVHDKFGYKS